MVGRFGPARAEPALMVRPVTFRIGPGGMVDTTCKQAAVMAAVRDRARTKVDQLTEQVGELKARLAEAQQELAHEAYVAEIAGRDLATHRCSRCIAAARQNTGPATEDSGSRQEHRLPQQDIDSLRGEVKLSSYSMQERQDAALMLLETIGAARPVTARDLVHHFKVPITGAQREGARNAFAKLVEAGKAVRLSDGAYLLAGSPLLPAQSRSSQPTSA